MAKEFRCGDVILGCPKVIESKDDEDVMGKAVEHTTNAHNMPTIPPEVAGMMQEAILTN